MKWQEIRRAVTTAQGQFALLDEEKYKKLKPYLVLSAPPGQADMDSFFARDIQQLYAFRDATKFTALFEYLLKQSSGLLEITRTASALGVSRPTVEHHLQALATAHAVTLVDPAALKVFRTYYPEGVNYLISPVTSALYKKTVAGLDVYVCNPDGWAKTDASRRSPDAFKAE